MIGILILLFVSASSIASSMKCVDRLEVIHEFIVIKDRLKNLSSEEAILTACEENKLKDILMARKFRESRLAPVKAELHKNDVLRKTNKTNPFFKKGESKVSLCNWKAKVKKEDIKLLETYLSKDYASAPLTDACRYIGLSVMREERPRKE